LPPAAVSANPSRSTAANQAVASNPDAPTSVKRLAIGAMSERVSLTSNTMTLGRGSTSSLAGGRAGERTREARGMPLPGRLCSQPRSAGRPVPQSVARSPGGATGACSPLHWQGRYCHLADRRRRRMMACAVHCRAAASGTCGRAACRCPPPGSWRTLPSSVQLEPLRGCPAHSFPCDFSRRVSTAPHVPSH